MAENSSLCTKFGPLTTGHFLGSVGVCLFLWTMGDSVPISYPIGHAGPKSVKVNLTNCHRIVCRIKFYQIATSDVLTSLWQFDKMLFDNLGHVFIHWVYY